MQHLSRCVRVNVRKTLHEFTTMKNLEKIACEVDGVKMCSDLAVGNKLDCLQSCQRFQNVTLGKKHLLLSLVWISN